MKHLLNWGMILLVGWSMVASAIATTITNASWTFPTYTISGPSEPIGSDLSIYSTGDYLAWISADSRLNVNLVPNLGEGTPLEFSYNGNHSEFLIGSAQTITSPVSEPPAPALITFGGLATLVAFQRRRS
jgi:hypothetical protein